MPKIRIHNRDDGELTLMCGTIPAGGHKTVSAAEWERCKCNHLIQALLRGQAITTEEIADEAPTFSSRKAPKAKRTDQPKAAAED